MTGTSCRQEYPFLTSGMNSGRTGHSCPRSQHLRLPGGAAMDKSDAYLPKCAEESGRRGAKEHQDADGVNRCAETRCLQFELTQLCRHPHLPEPTSCPTRAHTRACAHVRIVFGHKCLYACVYILLHEINACVMGTCRYSEADSFLRPSSKKTF